MMNRRMAIKSTTALAVPFVFRLHAAAPSETVRHASFGTGGMALTDLKAIASHKNVQVAAICDVDSTRLDAAKRLFPEAKAYSDWRELLETEKGIDSVNVSTPDHMHAPIAMTAMNRGLAVYCQKPLTHTIDEARRLAEASVAKKLVTQMGIQIHSHEAHRTTVKLVQSGAIGRVSAVHSWMGKGWGDPTPLPDRKDAVPATFKWDNWLGVAAERPYIGGAYYHPDNWRKRLDFGGGTLGDMGCHLLDPIFTSLELKYPTSAICSAGGAHVTNWGLDNRVEWTFPGTKYTTETLHLTWTDGGMKPPAELLEKYGIVKPGSGTLYIGEKGAIHSPYYSTPKLLPAEKFREVVVEKVPGVNHWHQFIDAVRGLGKTSTPFSYAGPLTETVLLGCLAERFVKTMVTWNGSELKASGEADKLVKKEYRKGWEVKGL